MEGLIVNYDYYVADLAENKIYEEVSEGIDMSEKAFFHSVSLNEPHDVKNLVFAKTYLDKYLFLIQNLNLQYILIWMSVKISLVDFLLYDILALVDVSTIKGPW